ncbi:MAG: TetR/AcrR family transcriptional regulator [Gemmatimonadota bacterium]
MNDIPPTREGIGLDASGAPESLNPPRQARSRATLERILTATRTLLEEREFADITVDDIVQGASSSKGSFYHRFADKEALLVHLLREEHEAATRAWTETLAVERWEGRAAQDLLDAFIDHLLGIYSRRAPLMRAYAGSLSLGAEEVRALSGRLNRHVLAQLRAALASTADGAAHPDPARATAFVVTALLALMPALFLGADADLVPEPLPRDVLEQEIRRLVRRYLLRGDEHGA